MTDQEILTKAFNLALKGGYKPKFPAVAWFKDINGDRIYEYQGTLQYRDYFVVIFSHEFARCFFGESLVPAGYANGKTFEDQENRVRKVFGPAWQIHLQQMVIKENPLDYLAKYL